MCSARAVSVVLAGASVGVLGGLIGLGGAEFRLPLLISVFGFTALRGHPEQGDEPHRRPHGATRAAPRHPLWRVVTPLERRGEPAGWKPARRLDGRHGRNPDAVRHPLSGAGDPAGPHRHRACRHPPGHRRRPGVGRSRAGCCRSRRRIPDRSGSVGDGRCRRRTAHPDDRVALRRGREDRREPVADGVAPDHGRSIRPLQPRPQLRRAARTPTVRAPDGVGVRRRDGRRWSAGRGRA